MGSTATATVTISSGNSKSAMKMLYYAKVVGLIGFIFLWIPSVLGGYKEEHEGFVKNFKGTSAFFVIICLSHLPASILLLKIMQGSSKSLFVRDMLCLVLPILLNMTVLADYCYITIFLLVGFEMLYIFHFNPYRMRKASDYEIGRSDSSEGSFSGAITRCRKAAYLNLFKGKLMQDVCETLLHRIILLSC